MNKLLISFGLLASLFISSVIAMHRLPNHLEYNSDDLTLADIAKREKEKEDLVKLRTENQLLLFRLSHRFDHDDLVQAAKPSMSTQKIVTKENSTVISLPEATHKIALNHNGNAVAIAYGNKLKVLQKKSSWADDVYENGYRFPLNKVAFTTNNELVHAHNKDFFTLALKNKMLQELSRDKMALFSTISTNGKWRFIEEIVGDKILCTLFNINTGLKIESFDISKNITHVKAFVADAAGENFFVASSSKIVGMHLKIIDNTLNLHDFNVDTELTHISDIDISSDGNFALAAGDKSAEYFRKTNNNFYTGKKAWFTLPFFVSTARFSPHNNNHVILGGHNGIFLLKITNEMTATTGKYFGLFSPENASIECLSISGDGDTIAAGTENAAYIINCKDVEKSLSASEHLLIRRLDTESSEKIFESPAFLNIFKNFSNPNVAQQLVKKFSIDYKKLGYEQCSICLDNYANAQTSCKHCFCSDCLDRIKEENKPVCPLCRGEISKNEK
jgi:hypothetical protein